MSCYSEVLIIDSKWDKVKGDEEKKLIKNLTKKYGFKKVKKDCSYIYSQDINYFSCAFEFLEDFLKLDSRYYQLFKKLEQYDKFEEVTREKIIEILQNK